MIKRLFVVLLLLTVLFAGCASQKPADLQPFSPEGGRFSVMLPGTPKNVTQTVNTAAGPIVTNMYSYEEGGIAYLVMYADYPEESMKQTTPEEVLDGARDGAVANVYGTLLSETLISIDGYPGRQLNIGVGEQGVRARVYLVNNRMYSILATGPGQRLTSKTVVDVLDSFKLTK